MSMALSLKKLKSMSYEELVESYDEEATHTVVGTKYYLDEIRYRETSELNDKVVALTRWITALTIVITVATIVNVAVFLNDSPSVPGFIN